MDITRSSSWILIAFVFAGCGKTKEQAGAHGASCRDQAAELGRFLTEADQGPPVVQEMKGLHLVARPELPAVPPIAAPVVSVYPHELRFRGLVVSIAELREHLEAASHKIRDDLATRKSAGGPPDPRSLILQIDDGVAWSDVVAVAEVAAKTSFDRPLFVFQGASKLAVPPPSSIDGELDRITAGDGSSAATQLAKLMSTVVKDCPALQKAFGAVASDGGDKAKTLIAAIPPALVDCGCEVEVAALRSLMWRIVTNRYPVTAAPVTLVAGGASITLPASTPWREASKRFTASANTVTLAVGP